MKTKQVEFWSGNFGKEYTDRNPQSLEDWDQLYVKSYGFSKTDMNSEFIGHLSKDIRILEVGCNVGMQLAGLQRMGFTNLYGIELQPYAVERSKEINKGLNIIQGSGFDIPFKDGFFDLVLTNGVLIHIAPADLPVIMKEMARCSKKYILGFEYYAEKLTEVKYRGNEGYLWKCDYAEEFLKNVSGLSLVKKKVYPYISETEKGNKDFMYLLEKK
jgi:pseudaminic acid biosynthesis-associated methylase